MVVPVLVIGSILAVMLGRSLIGSGVETTLLLVAFAALQAAVLSLVFEWAPALILGGMAGTFDIRLIAAQIRYARTRLDCARMNDGTNSDLA